MTPVKTTRKNFSIWNEGYYQTCLTKQDTELSQTRDILFQRLSAESGRKKDRLLQTIEVIDTARLSLLIKQEDFARLKQILSTNNIASGVLKNSSLSTDLVIKLIDASDVHFSTVYDSLKILWENRPPSEGVWQDTAIVAAGRDDWIPFNSLVSDILPRLPSTKKINAQSVFSAVFSSVYVSPKIEALLNSSLGMEILPSYLLKKIWVFGASDNLLGCVLPFTARWLNSTRGSNCDTEFQTIFSLCSIYMQNRLLDHDLALTLSLRKGGPWTVQSLQYTYEKEDFSHFLSLWNMFSKERKNGTVDSIFSSCIDRICKAKIRRPFDEAVLTTIGREFSFEKWCQELSAKTINPEAKKLFAFLLSMKCEPNHYPPKGATERQFYSHCLRIIEKHQPLVSRLLAL